MEQVFREAGESPQLEVFRICLGQTQRNPAYFESLLGAEGWSGDPRGPFPHESSCGAVTNKWVHLVLHFFS